MFCPVKRLEEQEVELAEKKLNYGRVALQILGDLYRKRVNHSENGICFPITSTPNSVLGVISSVRRGSNPWLQIRIIRADTF